MNKVFKPIEQVCRITDHQQTYVKPVVSHETFDISPRNYFDHLYNPYSFYIIITISIAIVVVLAILQLGIKLDKDTIFIEEMVTSMTEVVETKKTVKVTEEINKMSNDQRNNKTAKETTVTKDVEKIEIAQVMKESKTDQETKRLPKIPIQFVQCKPREVKYDFNRVTYTGKSKIVKANNQVGRAVYEYFAYNIMGFKGKGLDEELKMINYLEDTPLYSLKSLLETYFFNEKAMCNIEMINLFHQYKYPLKMDTLKASKKYLTSSKSSNLLDYLIELYGNYDVDLEYLISDISEAAEKFPVFLSDRFSLPEFLKLLGFQRVTVLSTIHSKIVTDTESAINQMIGLLLNEELIKFIVNNYNSNTDCLTRIFIFKIYESAVGSSFYELNFDSHLIIKHLLMITTMTIDMIEYSCEIKILINIFLAMDSFTFFSNFMNLIEFFGYNEYGESSFITFRIFEIMTEILKIKLCQLKFNNNNDLKDFTSYCKLKENLLSKLNLTLKKSKDKSEITVPDFIISKINEFDLIWNQVLQLYIKSKNN
ncbi:hypothetical protein B5S33_g1908 [[Candida] boidinii]|nr:hypothetical protein B5S33_g1908 [[Candida] boidinii]